MSGFYSCPVLADFTNRHKTEIGVASPQDGTYFLLDKDGQLIEKSSRTCIVANLTAATARSAERPGMFAFEEGGGAITLVNRAENAAYTAQLEGAPVPGAGLLFADINADGIPELLASRRDGVITVFDRFLNPRWQFDAGAPLESPLAVAPVFNIASAIYCVTTDGVLHAFTGTGRPFWQFTPDAPDRHTTRDGPLVLQLAGERPSVLYTNDSGCVYAVDAIKGHEQWHTQLANGPLGTPAIIDYSPAEGRCIITVSLAGQVTMLDVNGEVKMQAHLPGGNYVLRPLVADVDGDNDFEIVVANDQWEILVAALDGAVKRRISLQGNATGMILANLEGRGYLDLLVTTDCGRLYRFSTKATDGWLHPRANAMLNGFLLPITVIPLPPAEAAHRAAYAEPVVVRDFVKQLPYASAAICPRKLKGAKYASVVLRQQHTVLGSCYKPLGGDGTITVPFVETLDADIMYDLGLYDHQGKIMASSTAVPVAPPLVKLIELPSTERFTQALAERGTRYAVPQQWSSFSKTGSPEDANRGTHPDPVLEKPGHSVEIGDDNSATLMELAWLRGEARQIASPLWGVTIASTYDNAFPVSLGSPELVWTRPHVVTGPACGHSASLMYRLAMAAWLSGAASINFDDNGPADDARKKWMEFTERNPARGVPFTPIAFLLDSRDADGTGVNAAMRHLFAQEDGIGFEGEFLTCGPYGNVFDLITKDASPTALQAYGVLWPLGQFLLSREQIEAMIQYVKSGGVLVLDAATAGKFPAKFTGVDLGRSTAIGSQVQTALGPLQPVSAPFQYTPMTVNNKAETIAWTDAGAPFLTWHKKEDGIVVVSAGDQWIDDRGRWLPSSALLLKTITTAFVPVQPPVTAPMFINRLPDGWLLGFINNAGVAKAPATPPVIDPGKDWDGVLRFTRQIALQFKTLAGEFQWSNNNAGLHVRISPGEIGAVQITTGR